MRRAKALPPAVVYAFMALVIILLVVTLAGLLDTFWLALASSAFFGTVGVLRVAGVVERPPDQPGLRYDLLYLLLDTGALVGAALRFIV